MITQQNYFYDAVILAPYDKFFSAKCSQFFLAFIEQNQMMDIFPAEMLSFIFETNHIKK